MDTSTNTHRASAFDLVASQPWAIQPDMLETIALIARRENDSIDTVEARLGRPLQNARKVSQRDGIAIVPITGPVFRYANMFTEISGATSLEVLARDFTAAVDDPAITSIVLNIDSPGGQANGIAEFAALVRAASKPVTAYVDGMAASAAYWIAAAADRIVMGKTAMAGSIGAVLSLDAKKTPGTIEIVSSQSPNKRPDVATDAGRAQIQRLVDSLAQVFVDDVAAYRGVDPDTVLAQFGQGEVFIAADAMARGMADEISTLETLIAGLSGSTRSPQGGRPMTHEANGTPAAETPAIDRAYLAANHADLLAALHTEGATAERARILGIQAQAKGFPGHDDLVAKLIEDGQTTAADAAVQILAAERGRGEARADALRADAPAPLAPAAQPTDTAASHEDVEHRAAMAWESDPKLRSEFTSLGAYTAYLRNHEAGRARILGKK